MPVNKNNFVRFMSSSSVRSLVRTSRASGQLVAGVFKLLGTQMKSIGFNTVSVDVNLPKVRNKGETELIILLGYYEKEDYVQIELSYDHETKKFKMDQETPHDL